MLERPLERDSTGQGEHLVGVLSNCASTRNRHILTKVRRLVESSPHVFHYEFDDIATIPEALALFADARVGLLVINGGDGTIQAVLTSLLDDRPFVRIPPIAVLPSGRTNMIAEDLGARGAPVRILRRLLRRFYRRGIARRLTKRALIRVDLGNGMPPRTGMFFGTAGVVNGILWCRRRVHPMHLPNPLAHVLAIVGLILKAILPLARSPLESGPQRLTLGDGRRIAGSFSVVLATTLDHLLLRLRPFGREGKGALKFSAVESGGGALLRALIALASGRFARGGVVGLHIGRTDYVRIEGNEPVTLDGEIYYPEKGRPVVLRATQELDFVRL